MRSVAETYPGIQPERARTRRGADPMLPPGSGFCRCADCEEYFLSERAFGRHRTGPHQNGDRACMTTPRMRDAGFERDARGYWRLPKREFSRA